MAERPGRCVLEIFHVNFQLPYATYPDCTVQLHQTQIQVLYDGEVKTTIALSCMKSIEIHQPIFSANYISGQFFEQGSSSPFTMTFNKGGATDFARAFFHLTEGQLVSTDHLPNEENLHQESSDDKKTK